MVINCAFEQKKNSTEMRVCEGENEVKWIDLSLTLTERNGTIQVDST